MTTPRLGAPELTSGQAVPETTVNEQIRYIEAGAGHFIFKSRVVATPPGSPADGDCYLVAASPTGVWTGKAGNIAFYVSTAWEFITAIEGFTAWVNDENVFIGYDGAAWNALASPSGVYIPLTYLDTDGTLAANSDTKIASQKAAKTYIDGKVAGLSWKQEARAATTSAHTLATDFANASVIDGVTLATGDRVLIKNQATASENGIYVVAASGAPTRATDADSGSELVDASIYVSEGTTNSDTQWVCTTNAPITPGTTGLSFAQLTSGGGALLVSNNLSDVANASTSRTNLGAAASGAATASGLTMSTNKLLGRTTAATGAIEEIAVGAGLALAGGLISAGPGTGAASWALIDQSGAALPGGTAASWTFSTNVATVNFTGLASYTEIVVLIRGMTLSVSGIRCVRLSTDNGSTYYSGATDYAATDINGLEGTGSMIFLHSTSTTAARTSTFRISAMNLSGCIKALIRQENGGSGYLAASTSPITALQVIPSAGGFITGGSVLVFAR